MSYSDELVNKQYQENVVIKMLGEYFAFHQPDSGLAIKPYYLGTVASCVLNPTQVDLKKPNTTISSYSFKIIDKSWCLTNLVQGTGARLNGQQVEIYIGRVGVAMDFAEYKLLPLTRIKNQTYTENAYNISTSEETDRIDKAIYEITSNLLNDILESTTIIAARDDISDFPSSGYIIISSEIIQYADIDLDNNFFLGCIRGEHGSKVDNHSADEDIFFVERIQGNPIDILLSLLTSGSGAGDYDVLVDGCAIDPSLIDVSGAEALRDSDFADLEFGFYFQSMDSALRYIEDQILTPLRLRMVTNEQAKISIRQMDRIAVLEPLTIDDDSIRTPPKWVVDDNRVINQLVIEWDYDQATGKYTEKSEYRDEASITNYGDKNPLKYQFDTIRSDLDGQAIIDNFAALLLNRLAEPLPEITLNTHIDKSEINVLDRIMLNTDRLPSFDGSLKFSNEVEVISRAINHNTGDVAFKLVFTSGSLVRFCYTPPSDLAQLGSNQVVLVLPSGRGAMYRIGWKVRLYDNLAREYVVSEPVNTITNIIEENVEFENDWITTIVPGRHRMKFADYDEVIEDQKRFCFISAEGGNFSDGKRTYVLAL